MNLVILSGRLTKDPVLRYTAKDQQAVVNFTLAIDRGYGEDKKADFPRIAAFGKTAEFCDKWLRKGNRVEIEGSYRTGSYQDQNGETVYTTNVLANRVHLIDWPNEQGQQNNQQGNQQNRQNRQTPGDMRRGDCIGGQNSRKNDDIPDQFEMLNEDVPF